MYVYIKSAPKKRTKSAVVTSWVFMTLGSLVLLWSMWPILSFVALRKHLFGATVSPVADVVTAGKQRETLSPIAVAASSVTLDPTVNAQILGQTYDTINPNLWFPQSPQKKVVTKVNSYTLSIPKLKIRDATVIVAGDDLSKSLVHYGGTAVPGTYGNTVVFGHSTLPQFYSPTNYKAIFSLLPTLTIGDEIYVNYDGISYKYVVMNMVITKPNDLSPLEQRFDDSYLTLITCVPPGTYWERLNVIAALVTT